MPPSVAMSTAVTPADLTISPRDVKFNRSARADRWWLGGDPIGTAFFNALSVSFPQGEAHFIETVRRYRDAAEGELVEQIALFIKQEVMHTREHVVFNRLVSGAGYDIKGMDAMLRERLDFARSRPPIAQLAMTVALEHFTAIMANDVLRHPEVLKGASQDVADMWRWHAIEEIEHKAVAFDTFQAATRDLSSFKRWRIRSLVMFLITIDFWKSNFKRMAEFYRQDNMNTFGTWMKTLWYIFGKPGVLRRIFPAWLKFFSPRFHPWNHDDRALIAATDKELSARP
jgi:predicted metal-dependent hydrolase